MNRYELRLDDGTVRSWPGASPEDAAARLVDSIRVAETRLVSVVAWRHADRYGIHVGIPARIIE